MRAITDRQTEILLFVEKYIANNGYSPSIREVAKVFKISVKGAHDHILALVKKDYLRRGQEGKARTLTINEGKNDKNKSK